MYSLPSNLLVGNLIPELRYARYTVLLSVIGLEQLIMSVAVITTALVSTLKVHKCIQTKTMSTKN